MLKKVIFYFLFIQVTFSFAEIKKDSIAIKKKDAFNLELKSFIDTMKGRNGNLKYFVFVARVFNSKPNGKDFCFTLGYILNEYELDDMDADYVYYFYDEIILIRMGNKTDKTFLEALNLKPILEQDCMKISNKLFPQNIGGITYIAHGLIYCANAEKTLRNFYENEDDIPLEISVYGNFPVGMRVEEVSPPKRDSLQKH
ncbi:MAG: hypothetical protein A3G23_11560 [Bacteroidetes bacterium RIFCSPLOWO2_12_FULL_37_12]|nr:MAG: hypothetical protein A3G23_11560 [Bacteroidetes bacterium RIFCSPLOWO2_12_FULL_37_12]